MTVIAGASLFSGVLLVADSRATYESTQGSKSADHVQKLIPLGPYMALGFSGNGVVAGHLLLSALKQVTRWKDSRRLHPLALTAWLPRLFARNFASLAQQYRHPEVSFVVGGIVRGRPNVVERSKVVALMERFRLESLSHQRNWLPPVLLEVLMTPTEATHVALGGRPAGILATMSSPSFELRHYAPLSAVAIGSGQNAVAQIDKEADWVFAGAVGQTGPEAMALRDAVRTYVKDNKIDGVGGLFPGVKISEVGCQMLTYGMEIPAGGTRIELAYGEDGRFEQRNLSTGKTIRLLFPWELKSRTPSTDLRFDDLDDVEARFRGGA